jgi:hypothetical protein
MWRLPDRNDFALLEGGLLKGVGKLEYGFFSELQRLSLLLLQRAKKPKYSTYILISQVIPILENFLHRLEFIATNFRTMQLGVRETQRMYLELLAVLDYEEIYRPLMDGLSTNALSYPPATAKVMGAFTMDLTICDRLFRAGIPVWLMRPFDELHSIRVRALAPLQVAGNLIPLDATTRPTHPTIYCGGGDNIAKYHALARHVLSYLRYPNPFGSIRAKQLITPPPPQSKREERRQQYTPCGSFLNFIRVLTEYGQRW